MWSYLLGFEVEDIFLEVIRYMGCFGKMLKLDGNRKKLKKRKCSIVVFGDSVVGKLNLIFVVVKGFSLKEEEVLFVLLFLYMIS